jgi:Na+/H+ antiporter NhaA
MAAIPPRLRDRPTPDLIVLALTAIVIMVLAITVVALVITEIWYPERDQTELAKRIGSIMSSLIAAIVGYLAGRGVTNGNHKGA